jgi:hypothetical protein
VSHLTAVASPATAPPPRLWTEAEVQAEVTRRVNDRLDFHRRVITNMLAERWGIDPDAPRAQVIPLRAVAS